MSVKDEVKSAISDLFFIDEAVLDALDDEVWDNVDSSLSVFYGLPSRIDELFTENGEAFIDEVRLALDVISSTGADIAQLLPRAANLVRALEVANAIFEEQLDEDVPPEVSQFRLDEYQAGDGLFEQGGDQKRVFFYQHPNNLAESVGYFDFTDNALIPADELDDSSELNVVALIVLCRAASPVAGKRWVVSTIAEDSKREALLKYHALLSGCVLTKPVSFSGYDGINGIPETLRIVSSYEQFAEPFEMLSEFNGRTTILDSYLSAYHTLENYMIRARIAEVERKHIGSSFFSIRQFKNIQAATAEGEYSQLKALISNSWSLQIGGTLFSDYVTQRTNQLAGTLGPIGLLEPDFLHFMSRLGVPADLTSAPEKRLTSLIYQIRCSIVHNKETEYHISNRELLNASVHSTLTLLCIPVMRRLAFGLPSVALENPIAYSRQSIRLY
ncbi:MULTISPECIES: hypothetical protein [unclassified Shinella]|uniref:hypothetical protein n=1 Tax=unclassified Shinella TaxID=2643062 RepID=UPI00234F9665|nr:MULTISPECIES: hypothetical protein [unclassified Shinella]MCO5152835.1 hypothetical protein [Shinella sp.]MDC7260827.1 hypothetical protein [Shinella sp. HY16]MDC7267722.1 hypothetical protein [Shinella sp. YZ44]